MEIAVFGKVRTVPVEHYRLIGECIDTVDVIALKNQEPSDLRLNNEKYQTYVSKICGLVEMIQFTKNISDKSLNMNSVHWTPLR